MLLVQRLIATSHEGPPAPQEGVLHPAVALGCSCCRGLGLFGFCLLHAHLSLLTSPPPCTHITPATPPMALSTAAPKATPHAAARCFRSQLTPEHQCPQAAGPESPSRPQGLGNGPRSPALWKQKRKIEALPPHNRQSRAVPYSQTWWWSSPGLGLSGGTMGFIKDRGVFPLMGTPDLGTALTMEHPCLFQTSRGEGSLPLPKKAGKSSCHMGNIGCP